MKLSKRNWAYRIVKSVRPEDGRNEQLSVCEFWKFLLSAPILYAIMAFLIVGMSPFLLGIWLWEKADMNAKLDAWQWTFKCPLGYVEVIEDDDEC